MKKLLSHLLSYSAIELTNKAMPFLLLPILTTYLSVEDYGKLTIFQIVFGGGTILFSLGFTSIVSVDYYKNTEEKRINQLANVIRICVFVFLLLIPVSLVFSYYIYDLFILLVLLASMCTAIVNFFLAYFQVGKNIKNYAIISLTQTSISLLLTLVFVVYFLFGYKGRLIAFSLPPMLLAVFSYFYFIDLKLTNGNNKLDLSALRRAFPLLLHQMSNWARYAIDKIVLFFFLGEASLGSYNVNFQLAFILSILMAIINKTFQPYILQLLNDGENAYHLIKNQITLVFFTVVIVVFFIINFGDFILGGGFEVDGAIVFILGVAFFIQGIYFCFCNYLYFYEKGNELAKNSLFSLLFTLVASIPLVINYHGVGAASSILVSMIILLIGTLYTFFNIKNKS